MVNYLTLQFEFYCLIILSVKNLGVFCDSALCGVSLHGTRRKVTLHFPEIWAWHQSSPGTDSLIFAYLAQGQASSHPAIRGSDRVWVLSKGFGGFSHQTSLTASCCPVGGMATLPTTALGLE